MAENQRTNQSKAPPIQMKQSVIPPIRKAYKAVDQQRLIDHFIFDITGDDRRLRFGYPASDAAVRVYIEKSFECYGERNVWFIAVIPTTNEIVAATHVAFSPDTKYGELGCSVSKQYRQCGIGQQMFVRAIAWLASKGAKTVFLHCLSENKAMQHIAMKNGMKTVIHGGDRESTLHIETDRMLALYNDSVNDVISLCDYSFQMQKQAFDQFINTVIRFDKHSVIPSPSTAQG